MENQNKVEDILKKFNVKVDGRSGDEIRCLCPFHDDTKTSFSINSSTGRWKCFTEDIGGGLIKFVMKISKCDYKAANIIVNGRQNFTRIDVVKREEEEKQPFVKIPLPDEFIEFESFDDCPKYLKKRLTWETIKFFGLGKCLEGKYSGRIIIPIIMKKNVRGFTTRDYTGEAVKPYLFPTGFKKGLILFNANNMELSKKFKMKKEVVLVEGPFDAMSLFEKGFKNAICIFGISLSYRQIELLINKGVENIIMCFDNDEEKRENWGKKAAEELATELRYYFNNIYVMYLPHGMDPDECTKDELLEAYRNKKSFK